jgi:hypothetical protein
MIEVQVREQNVCDVVSGEPSFLKFAVQRRIPMQVVVAKKLFGLLVANSRIDQKQSVPMLDEHGTHCPSAQVVFISGHMFLPKCFGYYTEHGSTIQFKVARMNRMNMHGLSPLRGNQEKQGHDDHE